LFISHALSVWTDWEGSACTEDNESRRIFSFTSSSKDRYQVFCSTSTSRYDDHPAPARGQPPDGGSFVAHRLPASFAFGLTRRCAVCPNQIKELDPVLT
ncbi:hypothetical protein P0D72_41355, partial [Paraburkholderia sediminicola]|uniref:hypothetical protein n=1 Tax=Paraburkholderia sediminicola TaxID=458836 RepID=UPI0038BA61A7